MQAERAMGALSDIKRIKRGDILVTLSSEGARFRAYAIR
jgi:hypothetical protein